MSTGTVARRYARALYETALDSERVDVVDEDVEALRTSLDASDELVRFFKSPIVSREKKGAVVRALFEERVQPVTLRFLRMLIDKQREELLPEIVRAYRALRDRQRGVVEARARAAYELDEADRERLVRALEALSGASVRLEVEHDPELIGGLVVRIGDTVYDGSVRHQLANLREQLIHDGSLSTN